jgi:hypothetical protein
MTYSIKWTVGDIQSLRPNWTKEECANWLQMNWKHIQDRSIELGWEVIEALLPEEEKP